MIENDTKMVEEDQEQKQDNCNDEEKCLLQKEKEQTPKSPKTFAKSFSVKTYFSLRIKKMIKPEVLLILIALLLTLIWFEIICLVKHDHDQMRISMLQKQQEQLSKFPSFIDVSKRQGQSQEPIQSDSDAFLNSMENVQKRSLKKKGNKQKDDLKIEEIDWDNLEMIKPLLDEKEYKFMKLNNEIKVLLISSKETSQSYVAMDVRVGSWQEKIPGLAHFLEHMKFIATNEYTQTPNYFDNFLSTNQGSSNAYTDSDHTNYHYSVSTVAIKESLKIFSYMFNKSKFSREHVMKEINAVNSEYVNTLNNDNWKIQYLFSLLSKKNHPSSKFTCGSNETLISDKFDILKELDDFDKQNYSSNLMSLVVYSNQSIDELKSFVEYAEFEKIPNFNKETKVFKGISVDEQNQGKIFKLRLLNTEYKSINILFQILQKDFNKRNDYLDYFSSVLKSSEQGGFYDKMTSKNYITKVDVGKYTREDQYVTMMVEINITEEGYQNIDEILRSYYVFTQEFQKNANKKNFEEKKSFEDILFKYDANENIDEEAIYNMAANLSIIDKPNELYVQSSYKDFKKKNFAKFMNFASDPSKHVIILTAQNFDEKVQQNSKLFKNINNKYNTVNEFYNIQYEELLTLNEEQVKYLTTFDEQTEKEPFTFLYTLNLEYAPKGDISFYDAKTDDSDLISQNVSIQMETSDLSEQLSLISSSNVSTLCVRNFKFIKKIFIGNESSSERIILKFQFQQIIKDQYSEDPFQKTTPGLSKFAFSKELWNQMINEQNQDNQYHPIMLVDKDHMEEPQILCKLRLTNRNNDFISFEESAYQQILIATQLRFIEEEFSKAFESKYGLAITTSRNDMAIEVTGWDNNFEGVMKSFIQNIKDYQPTEEQWNAAKDSQIQSMQADIQEFSFAKLMATQVLRSFIDEQFISVEEKTKLIENTNINDQKEFRQNMFKPTNIDILFTGNISPMNAIQYTKEVKGLFQMSELVTEKLQNYKIVNLSNKSYVYQMANPNADDTNSLTINLYQIGKRDIKSLIYVQMLQDKLDRFFFEYLRTKKTLGYIAAAQTYNYGCVEQIAVVLQGDKKQPNEINQIIEKGFKVFYKSFSKLSEEDFKTQVDSFKNSYSKLPNALDKKIDYMWTQIDREKYDFDIRYYILNTLDTKLSLQEFQQFFQTHFHENASKFSFQVYTQTKPFDKEIKTKNYAKNLKENILIQSKEDITKLNEQPYHECNYSI